MVGCQAGRAEGKDECEENEGKKSGREIYFHGFSVFHDFSGQGSNVALLYHRAAKKQATCRNHVSKVRGVVRLAILRYNVLNVQ